MPFQAQTYRVLISSPSDLSEERAAVVAALGDWNARHSVAVAVNLLPVMTETGARPAAGRPQQAVNDQIVEPADILIGMFWMRLGTPTGKAKSGTVEEIEQFLAAGKSVMVYFSKRPFDQALFKADQHAALTTWRVSIQDRLMWFEFQNASDLRTMVANHLLDEVRELERQRQAAPKLDEVKGLDEATRQQREADPENPEFWRTREDIRAPKRREKKGAVEKGPNGFPVDYLPDGANSASRKPITRATTISRSG
jgi:hypothetical protein